MSDRSFTQRVLNIHFGAYSAVSLLYGCCHLKLLPSRRTLCVTTSLQCHFIRSHIRRVYVCLAATFKLHFWLNERGLLHAIAVTREWNWYQNKTRDKSTKSRPWRRNFSRLSYRDSKPLSSSEYESGTLPTLSYVTVTRRDNTANFLFAFTSALHAGMKWKSSKCLIRPWKSRSSSWQPGERMPNRWKSRRLRRMWSSKCDAAATSTHLLSTKTGERQRSSDSACHQVWQWKSWSEPAMNKVRKRESHTPRAERPSQYRLRLCHSTLSFFYLNS